MIHCTPESLLKAVRKTYPAAHTVGSERLAKLLGAIVDGEAYGNCHPCELVKLAANCGHETVELAVFTPHRVHQHVFRTSDLVQIGPSPLPVSKINWRPIEEARDWPFESALLIGMPLGDVPQDAFGHITMDRLEYAIADGWTHVALIESKLP